MNAVCISANEMDWQPALEYPGKAMTKVLNQGGSIAPRAILLRIPPHWNMEAHSHRYTELHYVLKGEYESDGDVFSEGTFRIVPKEVEHGPFISRQGATILIIWCALKE